MRDRISAPKHFSFPQPLFFLVEGLEFMLFQNLKFILNLYNFYFLIYTGFYTSYVNENQKF